MAKKIIHRPIRAKYDDKKKSKINIPMIVLPIINLIFIIILLVFINSLQMIPIKYIIVLLFLLLLIDGCVLLLLKGKKMAFNIIGYVISFVLVLMSSIGIYYVSKTNDFLDKAFSNKETIKLTYYIITSSNNNYTKKDINGDLYYFNNFEINDVKEKLDNNFSLNYIENNSLSTLFNNVKDGKIKFMLIDITSYSMAIEINEKLSDSDFKIVHEFTIETFIEPKENVKDKDIFTLFLCGSDFAGYNDLNMLITINLKTNKVLVTTIPRAYYIEIAGFNGKKNTLSFLGPYGISTSVASIENYFNINIDYYLKINTHSLVELVDEIGGITYCSDQAYYTTHSLVLDTYVDNKGKFYVKKGCQQLNGIQTLTVARERLAFYDGDRTRQKNCVAIMKAILEKMLSTNTLTNYESVLNALAGMYETDMSRNQISTMVKQILSYGKSPNIEMQSVDGSETMDYVHFTDFKDYVIYPTESTVIDAVAKINGFIEEK